MEIISYICIDSKHLVVIYVNRHNVSILSIN